MVSEADWTVACLDLSLSSEPTGLLLLPSLGLTFPLGRLVASAPVFAFGGGLTPTFVLPAPVLAGPLP
jgi:hypothetical protein